MKRSLHETTKIYAHFTNKYNLHKSITIIQVYTVTVLGDTDYNIGILFNPGLDRVLNDLKLLATRQISPILQVRRQKTN